jgi:hypothetical protein
LILHSELLRPQRIEFGAANVAESAEDVDRTLSEHLAQLKERLFRGLIGINNLSSNRIGFVRNLCRGLDTHTANLREQTDESDNVRLIVLKRVDIAMRRLAFVRCVTTDVSPAIDAPNSAANADRSVAFI